MKTISGSPGGGKVGSATKSGDPRPGVGGTVKSDSLNGFNSNPFKAGGANEVSYPDNMSAGSSGPKKGNAPKPERISDESSAKEVSRSRGGD